MSVNEDYLIRQSDIIPFEVLGQRITVIGAGAIGSFVVLALSKMGFYDIVVYDFDKVSDANMSCQWFRTKDIGKPKVEALRELIREFTDLEITSNDERFDGSQKLEGIVVSSVDSMKARALIWECVKNNEDVKWLIDPRMAAEYALSYVMNPHSEKDQITYEKTLYTDQNSVEEPCTAKATMYTATMIAGYVAKHVKDVLTKSTPYARTTHWNIGTNSMQNWTL